MVIADPYIIAVKIPVGSPDIHTALITHCLISQSIELQYRDWNTSLNLPCKGSLTCKWQQVFHFPLSKLQLCQFHALAYALLALIKIEILKDSKYILIYRLAVAVMFSPAINQSTFPTFP